MAWGADMLDGWNEIGRVCVAERTTRVLYDLISKMCANDEECHLHITSYPINPIQVQVATIT